MRRYAPWLALVWMLSAATHCPADDVLKADFEQGPNLASYPRIGLQKVEGQIVADGGDGRGHCLKIANPQPASECGMTLKGPIEIQPNLVLAFDYKCQIEPGFEGRYLGLAFQVDGKQWFWASESFSEQWRHAEVAITRLKSSEEYVMRRGLMLSGIKLYGRVKEKTARKGETKARMTVWLDNVRLYTGERQSQLSDVTRLSYSNPPMFNWARTSGKQRLQYSLDRRFHDRTAQTVELKSNFCLPPAPIQPGTWYWRVWSEEELSSGWSDIQTVVVPPDAHRFTTAPIPVDELTKRPHPRLLPLAKIGQPEVDAKRRADLIKSAKKLFARGVPEHPGPHVPGDPRWPTWIDWYGKVAGGITGGTGRHLQTIAQYAMLTGDPQVTEWTKQLALEACKWDPEGGSAMRLGDIGAHHLLRGLSWCYDACRESMTPAEREALRKILIQRANQFYHHLNPFRGSEANNHSWLQALALGEAGIVLLGDHDEAADWAEYARQLYLGRFLCCMGYQGDNNEGISYWGYGLGFIVDYGDLLRSVCGINLFEHPWLAQTGRFPMYCAPPGAWAVSFADTGMPNHGTRGPAETRQVRDLAIRTRDPYALWYSGQREPVDGLAPKPPTDLDPSIHYRHIGVAIFNTSLVDGREGVTVAMHSGPFFAGHQHADQNSFVIHAYGEKLAIDGGYYDWYGSPHFKAYSMQTLAHNTLLVDGRGQADRKHGADGRMTAWFDSPGYGYMVGDAAKAEIYGGALKQFDRRMLFIKPGLVIVQDQVAAAKEPARFDWLLHAIVPIQSDQAKKSFVVPCEGAALRGRFFSPVGLGLEVKTGFPVEPVNRYSTNPVPRDKYFPEWILYATPVRPAAGEQFLAVMQVQRLGSKAEPAAEMESIAAEGGQAVKIRCGDATHTIVLRQPGSPPTIRVGDLETDGDAAAVELGADGKLKRALAAHARSLVYRGQKLLQSNEPTDWATPQP